MHSKINEEPENSILLFSDCASVKPISCKHNECSFSHGTFLLPGVFSLRNLLKQMLKFYQLSVSFDQDLKNCTERAAMDFSGNQGRVIDNPSEAIAIARQEGFNWRVSINHPPPLISHRLLTHPHYTGLSHTMGNPHNSPEPTNQRCHLIRIRTNQSSD